jgi:hypothetical protein
MNIRKQLIAGVTAAALFLSTAAFAQRPGRKGNPEKMLDRQVTMMKEQLKLAPDQETKVRGILQESQTKMQAFAEKNGRPERGKAPSEEARAEMKKIREETKQGLANVLTADQLAQWEQMREKRGMGMRGHKRGGHGQDQDPNKPQNQ